MLPGSIVSVDGLLQTEEGQRWETRDTRDGPHFKKWGAH